jgi:hypothetical protein
MAHLGAKTHDDVAVNVTNASCLKNIMLSVAVCKKKGAEFLINAK